MKAYEITLGVDPHYGCQMVIQLQLNYHLSVIHSEGYTANQLASSRTHSKEVSVWQRISSLGKAVW